MQWLSQDLPFYIGLIDLPDVLEADVGMLHLDGHVVGGVDEEGPLASGHVLVACHLHPHNQTPWVDNR